MPKIIFMGLVLLLTGCATMFEGSRQDFTVTPTSDNSKNTLCIARNEEGIWPNLVPFQATNIHRDGNTMNVVCENDLQKGISNVEPKFQGAYLVLDLLLDFCIISCPIDGINNSFYDYPASVVVPMMDKKQAVRLPAS
jgi:hypothetical protein